MLYASRSFCLNRLTIPKVWNRSSYSPTGLIDLAYPKPPPVLSTAMSTRSSSRLRKARVKAEQTDTSSSTGNLRTITDAPRIPQSTTTARRIVKDEDGEPDEQTLARLRLEAAELRKALAADKRSKRNHVSLTGSSVKRTHSEEQGEEGPTGQANIKKSKYATKEPIGWEITLNRVREFRLQNPAPVDTMGCERLAQVGEDIPPEVID